MQSESSTGRRGRSSRDEGSGEEGRNGARAAVRVGGDCCLSTGFAPVKRCRIVRSGCLDFFGVVPRRGGDIGRVLHGREQGVEAGAKAGDGVVPGPVGGHVGAGGPAALAHLLRVLVDVVERLHERLPVRLDLPRLTDALVGPHDPVAGGATAAREAPAHRVVQEVIGGAAGGDDRREAAGHPLQDGQAEADAAVRERHAGAGAVERRQVRLGKIFLQDEDLRQAGIGRGMPEGVREAGAFADVGDRSVLHDQADVVLRPEGAQVGAQQQVGAAVLQGARRGTGSASTSGWAADTGGHPA